MNDNQYRLNWYASKAPIGMKNIVNLVIFLYSLFNIVFYNYELKFYIYM